MPELLIAAGLARRSNEDGGISTATQWHYIDKYCEENGYIIPPHLRFTDEDTSGGIEFAKRPQSSKLLALILDKKNRPFNFVIVKALDRLDRNYVDQEVLYKLMTQCGVTLLSVDQDLEDQSPTGILMRQIMGTVAEFERRMTGWRVLHHNRKLHQDGVHVSGVAAYGYKVTEKPVGSKVHLPLHVDEESAPHVIRMFELFAESCGNAAVTARRLNQEGIPAYGGGIWKPAVVRRSASGPMYRRAQVYEGELRYKPDFIPPLIPLELLQRVDDILISLYGDWRVQEAHKSRMRTRGTYSGLLKCAICGSVMDIHTPSSIVGRFRCRGSVPTYLEADDRPMQHTIQATALDTVIREAILAGLNQRAIASNSVVPTPKLKLDKTIEQKLDALREKKDRAVDMYYHGRIDSAKFLELTESADAEIKQLSREKAKAPQRMMTSRTAKELLGKFEDVWAIGNYDDMNNRELLIVGFGVSRGGIEVRIDRAADRKWKDTVVSVSITAPAISDEPLTASRRGIKKTRV